MQVTGIVGNPVILGFHGFYADSYRFCDLEGSGVLGPRLGAELGDGVRSSSVAGVGMRRIWGFPELAEPEER